MNDVVLALPRSIGRLGVRVARRVLVVLLLATYVVAGTLNTVIDLDLADLSAPKASHLLKIKKSTSPQPRMAMTALHYDDCEQVALPQPPAARPIIDAGHAVEWSSDTVPAGHGPETRAPPPKRIA